MTRPSASTIERALACPGHLALPTVTTAAGKPAERGNGIHGYLEAVGAGVEPELALQAAPEEWRPICAAIDLDRIPQGLAVEVALAYDYSQDTGRELGRRINRDYSGMTPTEIPGTADVLGVSATSVYAGDYKSGFADIAPAAENLQLRFLALAACRAYGKSSAVVEILRIKESGAVWRDRAELDELDLDSMAADLRRLEPRIRAAQQQYADRGAPDVSEGAWCKYCPSWGACPAKRQLIQQLGPALGTWSASMPLSPQQAGIAWTMVKEYEDTLRRVKSAVLAARAEFGELPLPSGKILREVIEPGNERLDGRRVFEVVRGLLGPAVAEQAVEIDASKASIGRALKAAAHDGTIKPRTAAKWERDIVGQVRAQGGAERPMRSKLVEFDPRAPAVEDATPASLPAHADGEE